MRWLLPTSVLGRFFLFTFLWLPFWFAVWYQMAGVLAFPAVWFSEFALNMLRPGLILGTEGLGRALHFIVGIEVTMPDVPAGTVAEVLVSVNPLIYTWNLPVLLALLFAHPPSFTYGRLIIAYTGLLPLHAWGVSLDILRTLALNAGSQVQEQLGFSGWQLEIIGLGYQFGYLMLPVIGAATLWIAMNRPLLETLLEPVALQAPEKEHNHGNPSGKD